ncbi:hypothetical protein LPJ66_003878 [Kickxella alabastrina]|uniref:Uncharacterized protein n=1 Tax=Kickxella alabastrina TaxID=61397 RepID=A0ACC1IMN3_9FUNG|nr:hypothetical protein LPJ66_003878 [Kickxella alabastrina]
MRNIYTRGDLKLVSTLRQSGVVVVNMAPQTKTTHIFNGRIVDPSTGECPHILGSNWTPFTELETTHFFHTFISATPEAYTVTVRLPACVSRYIRVQKHNKVLAVVAKAVARRRWTDAREGVHVHEQWRVYWRVFYLPKQCDAGGISAWYGSDSMRVVVPRRAGMLYRAINWIEERLWMRRSRTVNTI